MKLLQEASVWLSRGTKEQQQLQQQVTAVRLALVRSAAQAHLPASSGCTGLTCVAKQLVEYQGASHQDTCNKHVQHIRKSKQQQNLQLNQLLFETVQNVVTSSRELAGLSCESLLLGPQPSLWFPLGWVQRPCPVTWHSPGHTMSSEPAVKCCWDNPFTSRSNSTPVSP